jgi:hypothetical protein
MRELGKVSLLDALDYSALLAAVRPDKFDRAAVRWHGRVEMETMRRSPRLMPRQGTVQ